MDSCARCGRHLDDAHACPECDDTPTAAGSPTPSQTEEQYYRAKPFPQASPPDTATPEPEPVTEALPLAADPGEDAPDDPAPSLRENEPAEDDAFDDQEFYDEGPRPRRRMLILVACLGVVLLGAVVYGFAGPGLPWSGSTVSVKHDTPPTGTATDTATSSPSLSDGSPTATPSATPSKTPTATPSPTEPEQAEPPAPATPAAPASTHSPAPKPTPSQVASTPPPSTNPSPSPSPSRSCFLIFCR